MNERSYKPDIRDQIANSEIERSLLVEEDWPVALVDGVGL